MANINWLGGLKKELHHVKVMKDGNETYEPALVILSYQRKGTSFMIPIEALWKYIELSDNREPGVLAADFEEFKKLVDSAKMRVMLSVGPVARARASSDMSCIVVADALARSMRILHCTAFNLAKCLQIFDITPSPQAAAQLLMWIQDGLDDLRSFPEHSQENAVSGVAGEVTLFDGSEKIGTKPLTITEDDVYIPDEVAKT